VGHITSASVVEEVNAEFIIESPGFSKRTKVNIHVNYTGCSNFWCHQAKAVRIVSSEEDGYMGRRLFTQPLT
jgi:hypothetical protein